jgi:hypothetical protein
LCRYRSEAIMSDNQSAFVGSIPEHYDRNLGPIIFTDYAADIARRAAAGKPARCWRPPPAQAS